MRKFSYILLFALVFAVCLPLCADTVYLKNGNTLKGKIVRQTNTEVEIQVGHSGTVTIGRSEVEKVEINEDYGALDKPPKEEEPEEPQNQKTGAKPSGFRGFILGLTLGFILLAAVFAFPIVGFCLWLAIRIFDSDNPKNRYLIAVLWLIALFALSIPVGILLPEPAAPVVNIILTMLVLMLYYKLGFLKAVLVFFFTIILEVLAVILILVVLWAALTAA